MYIYIYTYTLCVHIYIYIYRERERDTCMISSHMHIMDNGQVYKSNRRMDDVLPPSEGTACWRLDKPGGPLRLTPAGMLYCAMQIFIRALLVRKPLTMWKSKLFFTNKARTYLNIRIPNIVFHNNSPHQYRQTCI